MSKPWHPQNWEEACKRNAGRKKLHQRKRKERADPIVRLLAAIEVAPELLESSYGWLSITAETMKRSKATASRDFQLARRIHTHSSLECLVGTSKPKQIRSCGPWDWSHYGFRTRESYQAGYSKAVGNFPFDTRTMPPEEAFCGLGPNSWLPKVSPFESMSTRDLISNLRLINRFR